MRRFVAFTLVACLLPVGAGAQAEAKLAEVERGVWAASHVGAVYYLELPGENPGTAVGSLIGIEVGYDLLRSLQIGVLAWGQSVGAPADYRGITDDAKDPRGARGDFQSMMLGGGLRWAFLRLPDENGVERTHFFVRGGAGVTLSRPVGILDERGIFGSGGLGVEYFTQLRHFSVGVELGWLGLFGELGAAHALTLLPHLKYTF
ncbi:MAG TPA: adventurous gliding motility protein CglE [Fredinandcohnia sp.]|nr:adventurous gliding motility protein CglE [Fredinandcohnia sp.]